MFRSATAAVRRFLGIPNPDGVFKRQQQFEIDMAVLLTVMSGKDVQDVVQLDAKEVQASVKEICTDQISKMFSCLHLADVETGGLFAKNHKMGSNSRTHSVKYDSKSDGQTNPSFFKPEYCAPGFLDAVKNRHGFNLSVEESLIEGAGYGVICNGIAPAGSIVAIYPGSSYLAFQVERIQKKFQQSTGLLSLSMRPATSTEYLRAFYDLFGTKKQPNLHMAQRYDGGTVNSKIGGKARFRNCFAVGHMINHPPPKYTPNVLICPFDFDNDYMRKQSASFDNYIPNELYTNPNIFPRWMSRLREKQSLVPSLVFVASREIQDGEELLVNYRFNPKLEKLWPAWYTPVDSHEDAERWASISND